MKRISFIAILVFGLSVVVHAQDARFRSLYLYQFTNYIDWPSDWKKGDFVIGVVGNTPVYGELKTLTRKRSIGQQKVRMERIYSINKIPSCHIIYVSYSRSDQLPEIIEKTRNMPTLIVTGYPGMAKSGAGISYVKKQGRLKFEINPKAIEAENLKLSQTLVDLGIKVK